MGRTPREILAVFDQMAEAAGPEFDGRSLLWEILNDVSSTWRLALNPVLGFTVLDEVTDEVDDYLSNLYGDD